MFYRGSTHMWKCVDGAWYRYDPVTRGTFSAPGVGDPSGGKPWGAAGEVDGWVKVPYRIAPKWDGVSGLHPEVHPECFEWEWPEGVIVEQYMLALEAMADGGNRYTRNTDGTLIKD